MLIQKQFSPQNTDALHQITAAVWGWGIKVWTGEPSPHILLGSVWLHALPWKYIYCSFWSLCILFPPCAPFTPWPQRFPIWKGSIRLPVFNKSYIYCSLSGIQDVFNCAVYFIRIFIVSVSALITRLHSFWVIPLLLTLFSPYKSSYILVPDFADHEVFQQRQCKRHACNR